MGTGWMGTGRTGWVGSGGREGASRVRGCAGRDDVRVTTQEIDQFGPWVLPVRGPQDVPPLYRDEAVDWDTVRFAIKVPRPVPRRDVTPGMDLYDALLLADPAGLTVLRRRPTAPGYDRSFVRHADVLALESSTDLLDGRLAVHTRSGPLEVAYNGSQADVVEELLAVLRHHAFGAGSTLPALAPVLARDAAGEEDLALVAAYRDLVAAGVAVDAVAAVPRGRHARRAGTVAALADAVRPVTRQGAVVAVGPAETHVLHRRLWLTTGRAPVHSLAHLVLPRDGRAPVELAPHPRLAGAVLAWAPGTPPLVLPEGHPALALLTAGREAVTD